MEPLNEKHETETQKVSNEQINSLKSFKDIENSPELFNKSNHF